LARGTELFLLSKAFRWDNIEIHYCTTRRQLRSHATQLAAHYVEAQCNLKERHIRCLVLNPGMRVHPALSGPIASEFCK
jgi:hypothetical protein